MDCESCTEAHLDGKHIELSGCIVNIDAYASRDRLACSGRRFVQEQQDTVAGSREVVSHDLVSHTPNAKNECSGVRSSVHGDKIRCVGMIVSESDS
jgi:hypothetical protein